MLDSDQEPSYNLSKNLLLLPRILKLIKDMADDSTPLLRDIFLKYCTFSIRTKVFVFHEKHMFETVEEEGNKGQRP